MTIIIKPQFSFCPELKHAESPEILKNQVLKSPISPVVCENRESPAKYGDFHANIKKTIKGPSNLFGKPTELLHGKNLWITLLFCLQELKSPISPVVCENRKSPAKYVDFHANIEKTI